MTYGSKYNLFLKEYTEFSNEEKLNKLKECKVKELLTLLRNIEESPREYSEDIIKCVYSCLYDKGIMCV